MVQSREAWPGLLSAFSQLTNILLQGKFNPAYQNIIFGGGLIALNKKYGGIRPIVVGYFWRRLAAKCACAYASAKLVDCFSPVQVGVGVSSGCEAAVHAARRFLDSMDEDQLFVKLDFANAFNCLHRDHELETVRNIIPEIYCICFSAYRYHYILQFGSFSLMSSVGPQ